MICANAEISGLDEMLARSYTVATGDLGMAGTCVAADQARWLRTVRNVCRDEACLLNAYRLRLTELNPFQPGVTFAKDMPPGPEMVAVAPPGRGIKPADMPDNPNPQAMTAEGRLSEEGGGYVLSAANGAQYVIQNFYFDKTAIDRFNGALVSANPRTRFRVSGFRAAIAGQNVFEARRCVLVHRLPG
jgi:hypothetical protein